MLKYEKEQNWLKISERCKRPTVEVDISRINYLRYQSTDPSEPICERVKKCNTVDYKIDYTLIDIKLPVFILDRKEDYLLSDLLDNPINRINALIEEELEEIQIVEDVDVIEEYDITDELEEPEIIHYPNHYRTR